MQKILRGVQRFEHEVFPEHREFFEGLACKQQRPRALFITCSDSRINPNLITQTEPGELFILRNAGNIVPPYSAAPGGEAATIEFAVAALGVQDVIVCGHSHCGAMKGLLAPDTLERMPAVKSWLANAEATRRIVQENYAGTENGDLLSIASQENVLVQLENLRTHPSIAAALARRRLNLHGWMYRIDTGQVFCYSPSEGQFLPLAGEAEVASAGREPLLAAQLI
jgi:carbonic anhydrase